MLKIVGDISLTDGYFDVGFGVGSKLADGFDPFSHLDRKGTDCWIGNFEGVASAVTDKTGMALQSFRVMPEYLKHIQHLDVYGLANNHAMQHGSDAYNETVKVLTALGAKVCLGGVFLTTKK